MKITRVLLVVCMLVASAIAQTALFELDSALRPLDVGWPSASVGAACAGTTQLEWNNHLFDVPVLRSTSAGVSSWTWPVFDQGSYPKAFALVTDVGGGGTVSPAGTWTVRLNLIYKQSKGDLAWVSTCIYRQLQRADKTQSYTYVAGEQAPVPISLNTAGVKTMTIQQPIDVYGTLDERIVVFLVVRSFVKGSNPTYVTFEAGGPNDVVIAP